MPTDVVIVASAFLTGAGFTVVSLGAYNLHRRLRAAETKLAQLEACPRHQLKHIVRADVGEAFLFDFAKLREDLDVATKSLETFTQHAQHVAKGGSPDDPPSTWSKE